MEFIECPFDEIDLNEIVKNIYIGDRYCAKNKNFLKTLGVKYIIVAGGELITHFTNDFEYLHIKVKDSLTQSIKPFFEETCNFI